jgi:hypothetical protein
VVSPELGLASVEVTDCIGQVASGFLDSVLMHCQKYTYRAIQVFFKLLLSSTKNVHILVFDCSQ